MKKITVLVVGLVVIACGSSTTNPGTDSTQDSIRDVPGVETLADDLASPDVQNADANDLNSDSPVDTTVTDQQTPHDSDVVTDTGMDAKPPEPTPSWDRTLPKVPVSELTSPVPFKAGAAVVRMPVPLGINTAGFGPSTGKRTPFTGGFPGTWTLYLHPLFKAVAMEGGTGMLVIERCDMVGALAGARQTVLKKLKAATGHDFSNEFILAGTHTHSGPGRLAPGIFAYLLDKFWPEFYDRITNAMTLTALKAIQAMKPAKFGWVMAEDSLIHKDRRCENPPLQDPQMPLLRFEGLDGKTIALVMVYAVHGTILGEHLHNLSRDVAGGIEEKIQEKIGGDFPVLFINSWAADMGPGEALEETAQANASPDIPEGYTRIEGIGNRAAKTVASVWDKFKFTTQVDISSRTFWFPFNRKVMGYKDDEFPYEYGAVYCSSNKNKCWQEGEDPAKMKIKGLDQSCLPFKKNLPGPDRSLFTVGHIGDLYFATWPGEAVTSIGEDIRDYLLQKKNDVGFAFFGYSQDYTGYSTPEWDWWLGGYEASGAMWGPKEGDYITSRIKAGIDAFLTGNVPQDLQSTQPSPEPDYHYDKAFAPMVSIDPGKVVLDVKDHYGMQDTVEFDVNGGDPWLLAPVAVLEKKSGDTFKPVMKPDNKPVNSDSYEFYIKLAVDPPYIQKKVKSRQFTWRFFLPITRGQAQVTPVTPGQYRLDVTGKYVDQAGHIQSFSTDSKVFTVGEQPAP